MNVEVVLRTPDAEGLPIISYDAVMFAPTGPPLRSPDGTVHAQRLYRYCLNGLRDATADVEGVVHHAHFMLTGDRDLVARAGVLHDCATCRAQTDQAMAYMAAHPNAEVILGVVYWAGAPGDTEVAAPSLENL